MNIGELFSINVYIWKLLVIIVENSFEDKEVFIKKIVGKFLGY